MKTREAGVTGDGNKEWNRVHIADIVWEYEIVAARSPCCGETSGWREWFLLLAEGMTLLRLEMHC